MASSGPVFRRSVSQPVARTASVPDPQVQALYHLPSVRIVAFTTPSSIYRSSSSSGGTISEEAPGTLPWTSGFERIIAVGPLRLYRAPGSVAFLNCANALQPILPKSQSWCVSTEGDRDTKIVLQIRRPNFWRIEIPSQNAEERQRIEEFKKALSGVLQFEKTPCPFRRNFSVDLPEEPKTPARKRPWKPTERQQSGIILSPELKLPEDSYRSPTLYTPARTTPTSIEGCGAASEALGLPLSDLSLQAASPSTDHLHPSMTDNLRPNEESEVFYSDKPAPVTPPEALGTPTLPKSDPGLDEEESEDFSDATDDTNLTPKTRFPAKHQHLIFQLDSDDRPPPMQNCNRSITAPPVLSLVTSPPSKHRTRSPPKSPLARSSTIESDSDFSSSVDSFHSVQSWHSPLDPPSPQTSDSSSTQAYPYPHDNITRPKSIHTRDLSELTVIPRTPDTPGVWNVAASDAEANCLSTPPQTPDSTAAKKIPNLQKLPEPITPPIRQNFRHRATTSSNSRRRALSPLPAAVNLFAPPPKSHSRHLQTARHLPTAIIQTTCKILLSPPSHLLHLMLNIASKIAAGEWRGFLSNQGENVYWDFEREYEDDIWHEDDYGMNIFPKSNPREGAIASGNDAGGSWEID